MKRFTSTFYVLQGTVSSFFNDACPRSAAAIAFYTMFSLPGLLVIVSNVAGAFLGQESVQVGLVQGMRDLMGSASATELERVLSNLGTVNPRPTLSTLFGIATLLLAATGAFVELQNALNTIWHSEHYAIRIKKLSQQSEKHRMYRLLLKRVRSYTVMLVMATLLVASVITSTLLNVLGKEIITLLPEGISTGLLWGTHIGIVFLLILLFFSMLLKILPDAEIPWRFIGIGATVAAVLFMIGKELLAFYLGQSTIGSTYGVASSLAIFLVWIYFSSAIFLLGAELAYVIFQHYPPKHVPDTSATAASDG